MPEVPPIEVPIRIVAAEVDDGAAQQRAMAEHVRRTGEAWLELAESIDALADWLDTLPRSSADAATDDPDGTS